MSGALLLHTPAKRDAGLFRGDLSSSRVHGAAAHVCAPHRRAGAPATWIGRLPKRLSLLGSTPASRSCTTSARPRASGVGQVHHRHHHWACPCPLRSSSQPPSANCPGYPPLAVNFATPYPPFPTSPWRALPLGEELSSTSAPLPSFNYKRGRYNGRKVVKAGLFPDGSQENAPRAAAPCANPLWGTVRRSRVLTAELPSGGAETGQDWTPFPAGCREALSNLLRLRPCGSGVPLCWRGGQARGWRYSPRGRGGGEQSEGAQPAPDNAERSPLCYCPVGYPAILG